MDMKCQCCTQDELNKEVKDLDPVSGMSHNEEECGRSRAQHKNYHCSQHSHNSADSQLKTSLELLETFLLVKCDEFESTYEDCATKYADLLDFALEDVTSSAVWRRTSVISKTIVKVCSICAEETTDLTSVLSLGNNNLLKRGVALITEYGASLLEPCFARIISHEDLELNLRKAMWEEGKLPFSLKMKRLGILCKCFMELSESCSVNCFKIIVSSTAQLYILSIFLQFLHYPINNEMLTPAQVTETMTVRHVEISRNWEEGLFLKLSLEDMVLNLLFLIQKENSWVQMACKEYLFRISKRNCAVKAVAIGLLQKFELSRVCTVMSTVIQIQMEIGIRESCLDQLIRSFATEVVSMCTDLDLTTKNGRALVTIGITACLTLCDKNHKIVNTLVWEPLLQPLVTLGNKDTNPDSNIHHLVTIQDLSRSLPLVKLILTLPEPFHRKFLNFQIFWNTLFAVYVATEKYLSRPVKDASNLKSVEEFGLDLQLIIYTSLRQAHRIGKDMSEYCVNMIINWKRSTKEVDPVLLEVLENESNIVFRRQALTQTEDPKRELYTAFQDSSKYMFRVLLEQAKDCGQNKEETIKILGSLCTKLFAFEAKNSISAEEVVLVEQLRNSFASMESREKSNLVHLLDLTDEMECRKYVSTLLLAEFGSCEDLIDEFLQADGGKDASIYLTLIFNRLSKSLEEYESNPQNATMEFDFSRSVVFALELLNTLCEVTYDEMTMKRSAEHHEFQSLCTWAEVQRFVPFLTKFQNTKLKNLVALGIPEKCADILAFIFTKGRGVQRKGVEKMTGLQNILFRVNSSDISMKVSGLVELRKRIVKKDPEILSNKDLITQLCYEEMENEDPYVFMHTINVLVALGGQYHESILPKLIQEYGFGEEHPWVIRLSRTEQFSLRLKLGEALVKLLKAIGPAAVKYRNPVLNACFRLANNIDPMVRESALVVLGDLCYSLELSVQTVLVQVWHSVETSLQTEKEPSVLRAHFVLVYNCLQGVGRFITPETAVDTRLGEFIRDVQRRVKFHYDTASDPVVRHHSQLCLDELKEIAVKLLTPQTELKHKIRVLH